MKNLTRIARRDPSPRPHSDSPHSEPEAPWPTRLRRRRAPSGPNNPGLVPADRADQVDPLYRVDPLDRAERVGLGAVQVSADLRLLLRRASVMADTTDITDMTSSASPGRWGS
jgi:hypothetical protein